MYDKLRDALLDIEYVMFAEVQSLSTNLFQSLYSLEGDLMKEYRISNDGRFRNG